MKTLIALFFLFSGLAEARKCNLQKSIEKFEGATCKVARSSRKNKYKIAAAKVTKGQMHFVDRDKNVVMSFSLFDTRRCRQLIGRSMVAPRSHNYASIRVGRTTRVEFAKNFKKKRKKLANKVGDRLRMKCALAKKR